MPVQFSQPRKGSMERIPNSDNCLGNPLQVHDMSGNFYFLFHIGRPALEIFPRTCFPENSDINPCGRQTYLYRECSRILNTKCMPFYRLLP